MHIFRTFQSYKFCIKLINLEENIHSKNHGVTFQSVIRW